MILEEMLTQDDEINAIAQKLPTRFKLELTHGNTQTQDCQTETCCQEASTEEEDI